jgi:hypothetical protein
MTQEPIAYINVEKRKLEFAKKIFWHTPTVANLDRIPLFTKEALAQEQEPVAWMHVQGNYKEPSFRELADDEVERGWEQYPLYNTPPQRSESSGKPSAWVGLTDKQTTQVIKSMPKGIKGWMIDWDLHDFSKAIEAKLKEKNT